MDRGIQSPGGLRKNSVPFVMAHGKNGRLPIISIVAFTAAKAAGTVPVCRPPEASGLPKSNLRLGPQGGRHSESGLLLWSAGTFSRTPYRNCRPDLSKFLNQTGEFNHVAEKPHFVGRFEQCHWITKNSYVQDLADADFSCFGAIGRVMAAQGPGVKLTLSKCRGPELVVAGGSTRRARRSRPVGNRGQGLVGQKLEVQVTPVGSGTRLNELPERTSSSRRWGRHKGRLESSH